MTSPDARAGARGARRRRRGGRPGERPPPGLEEAVAAAAREAFLALRGCALPPEPFPISLSAAVHPGERWQVVADPPLENQVRRAVREAAARRDVFRGGRVYCYRCESAGCEHAVPPAPGAVFGGYSSTGLPLWPGLAEVLLGLRHPRVDLVFEGGRRGLATAFLPRRQLVERQLGVFGRDSKTYEVLAEVVFGLLALRPPGAEGAEPDRAAFTLQAVETRGACGGARLELNVLGRLRDGSPSLEALADTPAHLRVLNVISTARRRLHGLLPQGVGARRGAAAPRDIEERAAAVLRDAARALERLGRQAGRRTAHAEERGRERRPTGKAREDALAAAPEALLRDQRRGTVVVVGPNQRVHVFSPEGRHITSLVLDAEAVKRRRRLERWEPLPPEARRDFLEALRAQHP